MVTGFYLLDRVNPKAKGPDGPYRFHGYIGRNGTPTCIVIHVAVVAPSTQSAEAVGGYLATTSRQASYHSLIDSDGVLPLIPYSGTAFHVVGFNTPSIGLSFACNTDTWSRYPEWADKAYVFGGQELAKMAAAYDIPLKFITRAQAKAGVKGVTFHAIMDPSRRTDPGAPPHGTFDIERLFAAARGVITTTPTPQQEDDMSTLRHGMNGDEVEEMQHLVDRVITLTGGWEEGSTQPEHLPKDGDYGNQTAFWVNHAVVRVERWVLKHPIYADTEGGARFTDGARSWLTTVAAGLEFRTMLSTGGTDRIEIDERFERKSEVA